jgi:branched-chain amino acid transport system substrate-binding protein
MNKYDLSGNVADGLNLAGYVLSQALVAVFKRCGDNLTRDNVMKQAASIHALRLPILQVPTLGPGIGISTSADDYAPVKEMRLFKFDGNNWVPFGALLSAASN